jgi:hypothetical protein
MDVHMYVGRNAACIRLKVVVLRVENLLYQTENTAVWLIHEWQRQVAGELHTHTRAVRKRQKMYNLKNNQK